MSDMVYNNKKNEQINSLKIILYLTNKDIIYFLFLEIQKILLPTIDILDTEIKYNAKIKVSNSPLSNFFRVFLAVS